MKKRISAMLLATTMVLGLASCGSSDPMEGTWKVNGGSAGGQEVTAEQLESFGMDMTMECKDGKITVSMSQDGEESQEGEGTYKVDGDKVTLESNGDTMEGTLDGDTFTFEQSGVTLEMKKQ